MSSDYDDHLFRDGIAGLGLVTIGLIIVLGGGIWAVNALTLHTRGQGDAVI